MASNAPMDRLKPDTRSKPSPIPNRYGNETSPTHIRLRPCPDSTSCFRTKVNLPSAPMRKTASDAGTRVSVVPSAFGDRAHVGRDENAAFIIQRERARVHAAAVDVLDSGRLAGLLIDGIDADRVLAAFPDRLSIDRASCRSRDC